MPAIDWTFLARYNLFQVAVVIVALYVLARLLMRFWPWLRKVMDLTAALAQLPAFIKRTDQTLAEQDSKIAEIHHEVKFNNGSSVKDAVTRVELGVKGIYHRLDDADRDRKDLRDDLEHTQPARIRAKPKE